MTSPPTSPPLTEPLDEFTAVWQIESLRNQRRFDEAAKAVTQAAKSFPTSADVLMQRAWLHYDRQQFNEAAEAFADVLKIDPEHEAAWEGKLVALRLAIRLEDAENEIKTALEKLPNSAAILTQRGLLDYEQKQYSKAVEAFDRALSLAPYSEFAWEWKLISLRFGKQFEQAEKEVASALERLPDNVAILNQRGLLHFDQKQYGKAVADFNEVLSLDPDNEFAWEWKLISLRLDTQFEEAEKEIAKALGKFPGNVKILTQRGLLHYDQKQFDEAVKAFNDALASDPNDESAWEWNIISLRTAKRFEEAEKKMTTALERLPGNVTILNQRGLLYYDQEQYGKAIEAFTDALRNDPDNEVAWEWKLISLRLEKRFADAENEVAKALKKFPNNVKILYQRGRLHYEQKRYTEAAKAFSDALKIEPKDESTWEWKLISLRFAKQFEEAEKEVAKALEMLPGSARILNQRGLLLHDQNQHEEAFNAFSEVLKNDPDNEFAWEWRLASLRFAKKFEDAEKEMAKALEKFPNNAKILLQSGQIHYEQKRYGEAIKAFDESLRNDPDNVLSWEWKLVSLRFAKQFEEAEKEIAKAIEKFPKNDRILFQRGLLHHDQKRYREAVKAFTEALEIDPEDESTWEWKLISLRFNKQFEDVEKELAKAFEKFPDSVKMLNQRGLLLYDQNQYIEAAEAFKTAQTIDPADEFSIRWRLISLRIAARFSPTPNYRELEKEFRAAIERYPDNLDLGMEYGWHFFDRRDNDKAITVFDGLIAKFPEDEKPLTGKIESLRNEQRNEEAIPLIRRGLTKWPESTELRRAKAALLYDQYKYEKAAQLFRELLAGANADPFDARLLISCLRFLHQDGKSENLKEAEAESKKALERFPKNPDLLVEAALLCAAQNQRDDAEDYFTEAQEIDCSNLGPRLAYADFLNTDDRGDKALEVLLKLKEEFADHIDVIEQLGWLYIDRGDLTNAESVFHELHKKLPLNAINGLGGVSFNHRDYTKAASYFESAVKQSPKHPVFNTNLAWAIARGGDKTQFSRAEELCKKALAANSTYFSARGCLGVIYFKEGRLTQAEDQFRISTRISSKGNYTELGALYCQMGKYYDAGKALTQALKNNPKDVQALIEMGNLYLQTGRNNDAVIEFRQAVATGPTNEDTHKALALALLKVERLDEAESVARTAIRNLDQEQRWPLHLTLAKILTQRGDNTSERQYYEEAMSEVTQAIDRRADRPEVFLHSGIIRYKLGDLVRSWQDFRKCHKMAPDNYEAERNAKLVRRQLLKASPLMKTTTWGGAVLAVVCVVQLWWIWRGFFSPNKIISEKMLLILVPLLLGLFVVSFLLPVLVHLKLPGGFEAQLSQPKASDLISSGPKGDVSFSNTSASVASGALGRD